MGSYKIIEGHAPDSVTGWSNYQNGSGNDIFYFDFLKLAMELVLSANHQTMVVCQVIDIYGSYPRKLIDPLRAEVRCIMRTALGDESSHVRDFDLQTTILQALETVHGFEINRSKPEKQKHLKGYAANEVSDWNEVIDNPFGLDVSTIQDTAYSILQKTPEELTAGIPKQWRVIHMESVLRHDLVKRFWNYQKTLQRDLESCRMNLRDRLAPHSKLEGQVRAQLSHESIIKDMITPRVTFHGTVLQSVGSIVRHGFKMPGTVINGGVIASPRSGIAFDRGIYSSQEAFYAMSYARGQREMTPVGMLPSMRLFVCATIMGRTYHGRDGRHGPLTEGYDSHFDGGFEYIVYNERAILPCYVIHLDLGSEAAKQALKDVQSNPEEFYQLTETKKRPEAKSTAPGDIQREKEARKAAALKWFPYGFGPATGTRFVIEEVGETSDDEEEYGDWQASKHGYSGSSAEQSTSVWDEPEWEYHDENGNLVKGKRRLMDQYQRATRSYKDE
ncbi:hypothetical protein FBEOM_9928 [Fusarium beomiforme]|uniref:PARP catalytic domain-containing protein n=1 Tax=Fusarium beomiforme TaxID=44412 RepID=A0A9P5AE08_9HYPO|nr:hypothetical protein FBEOM_9928 [Fusarium beomiforme]